MPSLREAARENRTVRKVALPLAFWISVAVFTDMSYTTVAPVIVLFIGIECGGTIVDAYGYPRAVLGIPIGLVCILVSLYSFFGVADVVDGGSGLVAALFAVGGAWLVLDGFQTYRRDGRDPRPSTAEEYLDVNDRSEQLLRFQSSTAVARAIRDEPRTVPQLADDLDLTESRVEGALTVLEERNHVYREDDVYRANEDKVGKIDLLKRLVRWVPRRFVRPFRSQP